MTRSGLHMPDSSRERSDQGIVKYVGSECKWLKVGDWVLYPPFVGTQVVVENEGNMISMLERNVTCIIGPTEWSATILKDVYFKQSIRNSSTSSGINEEAIYFEATFESVLDLMKDHAAEFIRHRLTVPKKSKFSNLADPEDVFNHEHWNELLPKKDG